MKNQKNSYLFLLWAMFIVLLAIGCTTNQSPMQPDKFVLMIEEYGKSFNDQDLWYLNARSTQKDIAAAEKQLTDDVQACLENTNHTEAKLLLQHYPNRFPTTSMLYLHSPTGVVFSISHPEIISQDHTTIVLQDEIATQQSGQTMAYYEELRIAIFATRKRDHRWSCSGYVHELGHARRHDLRDLNGTSHPLGFPPPELRISEETEMHEIQGEVLDELTQGEYSKTLEAIVEELQTESISQLILSIRPHHLDRVNELFDNDPLSQAEMNRRISQYLINISSTWIDKQAGTIKDKENAFAYIFQIFGI